MTFAENATSTISSSPNALSTFRQHTRQRFRQRRTHRKAQEPRFERRVGCGPHPAKQACLGRLRMSADEAWAQILRSLQEEMPRASFQTWGADIEVLSLSGDVLALGARNAYARDWLESRLTKTVERMLVGILNHAIAVRFMESKPPESPDDEGGSASTGADRAGPVHRLRAGCPAAQAGGGQKANGDAHS